MSKPACFSARALRSSNALHHTNPGDPSRISMRSGWSTLNTTIFAARRVAPPDLIVPAAASAPRMNDTGPDDSPPIDRYSYDERRFETLRPEPDPPLKIGRAS